MDRQWTATTVRLLLSLYKKNENLYNLRHKGYYDRPKRQKSYEAICERLKECNPVFTVDMVKKKIHNLRCQYQRTNRKPDANDPEEPTFWAYNDMEFLRPHCRSIRFEDATTKTNLQPTPNGGMSSSNSTHNAKPKSQNEKRRLTFENLDIATKRIKSDSDKDDEIDIIRKLVVSKLRRLRSRRSRNSISWKIQEILRACEIDDAESEPLSNYISILPN